MLPFYGYDGKEIAMDILVVVLRIVHVMGAIFWGGAALMMEFFISPSIAATAEGGQEFARHLINKAHIHIFMMVNAMATILAGLILYWRDSDGFTSAWMKSGTGIGFTIGAVFGIIAFISGAIFGRSNAQLGQIGAQIQGKLSSEQLAQLQAIQTRLKNISPIHKTSVLLAMLFMAAARYLVF